MIKLEGRDLEILTAVLYHIHVDRNRAKYWLDFFTDTGMSERVFDDYKDYYFRNIGDINNG